MKNREYTDDFYMSEAIGLAKKGIGLTSPNPSVGAVIVKDNKIIARGYHKKAGFPHAEIDALQNACMPVEGATMYVTLEPCSHFGRTPPCTEAIIRSGIRRVVVGEIDPNPLVNGNGIRLLRKNGVKVDIFPHNDEIHSINCGFRKWIRTKKPYVILKIASTLDGRIADSSGFSKYITSSKTRRFVHFIRFISDAVLIGAGTVKKDNPLLDYRLYKAEIKKPLTRIVIDGSLSLKPDYRIFRDDGARRIILTSYKATGEKRILSEKFARKGVEVIPFKTYKNRIAIKDILEYLGSINILYLLVEGGRDVFTDFIDSKETDLLLQMIAPRLFGESAVGFYKRCRTVRNSMTNLMLQDVSCIENDSMLFYFRKGSDVYRIDRIYRQGQNC